MHNDHVVDGVNCDAERFRSLIEAQDYYLGLAKGWKPKMPKPLVVMHDGVRVVRDDEIEGTKIRCGDLLMHKTGFDRYVYTQPRVGLAGTSILKVANLYDRKVTLFMAASKKISHHQACCIERGAIPIFRRCRAMSNLATWAKEWCDSRRNTFFVPLGLKHELATAAIVKTAMMIKPPEIAYTVISTGVLARALQIAWPETKFVAIAVGRNLKAGELGRAKVVVEPLEFLKPESANNLPPFPCVRAYDAKAWKYIPKNSKRDVLFWNVGCEPVLNDPSIIERTNSWRAWGEK